VQPVAEPPGTPRGMMDRIAVMVMVGVLMIAVGVVAMVALFMNRMGMAAAELPRVEPVADYAGRPSAITVNGTPAVNFLILATDREGALGSAMIAHLSADRTDFTLIGLPADLVVTDPAVPSTTLAASYRLDPVRTVRAVEALTKVRMDHQIHLDMARFADVVDALDGLEVRKLSPDPGSVRLDGARAHTWVSGARDSVDAVHRTMELNRAALARLASMEVITNPGRFDKVMDALTPCVRVDAELTAAEIEAISVQLQVGSDGIRTVTLATAPAGNGHGPGRVADPTHLKQVRDALAADRAGDLSSTGRGPTTEHTR